MKIDKPILKKINSGLKIATTIMASNAILFGVTTTILTPQIELIKKKQENLLASHQESEVFLEFREYEQNKFSTSLSNNEISLEEYEELIANLESKENVVNHFKNYATSESQSKYQKLEEDKQEVTETFNRGLVASIASFGGTLGLVALSNHIDEKLKQKDKLTLIKNIDIENSSSTDKKEDEYSK